MDTRTPEKGSAGQQPVPHTPTSPTDDGQQTLHGSDIEENDGAVADIPWENSRNNAIHFSAGQKTIIVSTVSLAAFTTTVASSIISPAVPDIATHFKVSETFSLLPLSLYVFALAISPILGGPLSESVGRTPVYYTLFPLGALFNLGCGLTDSFGALCFLRFMTGFCWGSTLSVAVSVIAELFTARLKGLMVNLLALTMFLGPGLGPILGAYATTYHDWRWTQYVLAILALPTILLICFAKETSPHIIKRRIAKEQREKLSPRLLSDVLQRFVQNSLIRPIHMLLTEPITTFVCLYIALTFGVLFSMYATVPYVMKTVYQFDTRQSGEVFISVTVGSVLGFGTVVLCDAKFYHAQIQRFSPSRVPPEYRLPSAMVGSVGLPVGLFWFAWTARSDVSWVSPAISLMPFSWGQVCVFVSTTQYVTEIYTSSVTASAASANAFARYIFAGSFPLFILPMLRTLSIKWGLSFFGFLTIALLPIPWVLFKFGSKIRAKSRYETIR